MSAYFGGTVVAYLSTLGTSGYKFRTPTADEVIAAAAAYKKTAEEAERLNREMEARQAREAIERKQWLKECKESFPVEGVSGDFDSDTKALRFWPSTEEEWANRDAYLVEGKCDFCGFEGWPVLQIDNSSGEYSYSSVCHSCIDKIFDAALKQVTG